MLLELKEQSEIAEKFQGDLLERLFYNSKCSWKDFNYCTQVGSLIDIVEDVLRCSLQGNALESGTRKDATGSVLLTLSFSDICDVTLIHLS
jgi:hypothetical protein